MQVKDSISFGFGYSGVFDADTIHPEDLELLEFFFGELTQIQFHVEEFSYDVRRITVEGMNGRLPRPRMIREQFTGRSGRWHQTKNGALLSVSFEATEHLTSLIRPVGEAFAEKSTLPLEAAE